MAEAVGPEVAAVSDGIPDPEETGHAIELEEWNIQVRETARRNHEERELAQARGPRVKRTAHEYAKVEQPGSVITRILAAEVNLLGGETGEGKSLLARDWCLHLAAGEAWRGYAVPVARNALYVASEGLSDFADRWESQPLWGAVNGDHRVFILDEPVSLVSRSDTDWLLKEYTDERPGLVVFDLIYGMGLPDDNGTKDVGPLIANMKRVSAEWKAATLALGHPGLHSPRRFRGWSGWRQQAATDWEMADGVLTCEKSKIAQRRALTMPYVAEYPYLRWLTPPEHLATAADRQSVIRADFAKHPDESDRRRAARLAPGMGLKPDTVRKMFPRREKVGPADG